MSKISIHALVKRATAKLTVKQMQEWFQSTPSWRGRHEIDRRSPKAVIFQSTPSWRGRHRHVRRNRQWCQFQSTPSWRGRRPRKCFQYGQGYFNPRPREEGDYSCRFLYIDFNLFQSTPSWRGRLYKLTKEKISKDFNPRPREEGDSLPCSITSELTYFNPRPREEGDFVF